MSENTFILTLDGDVDFRPDSVRLLLDRMKKNRKVGAVCGRIHPIGSGQCIDWCGGDISPHRVGSVYKLVWCGCIHPIGSGQCIDWYGGDVSTPSS